MNDETQTEDAPTTKKKAVGISKDAAIEVLTDVNPKRPGSASFARFEGYLSYPAPTTVQEALDAGLTMGDISYDFIHGSISVEGAEIVEYEPKKRAPKGEGEDEEEDEEVEATEEAF